MKKLIFIIVTFLFIGCCEVDTSSAQIERMKPNRTRVEIRDVETVIVRASGAELKFFKFEYDGHEYFIGRGQTDTPVHSPSCSCQTKSEIKSSGSLLDSFSW